MPDADLTRDLCLLRGDLAVCEVRIAWYRRAGIVPLAYEDWARAMRERIAELEGARTGRFANATPSLRRAVNSLLDKLEVEE